MPNLTPHPRLFATADDFAAIASRFEATDPVAGGSRTIYNEHLRQAMAAVEVPVAETGHNWHLIRMRHHQLLVFTLIIEYFRTGDKALRDTAIAYMRLAAGWEYWSWIDWRDASHDTPQDTFDLSFGELCMTVACVWDWLYDELAPDERNLLISMARRLASAYLKAFEGEPPWWGAHAQSNWTTVTNGGAGMLALAMWEELDWPREMLQHAEYAAGSFYSSIDEDGGWEEGLGYWNYGMRYGFLYLLSHEAATRREHYLLDREPVRNTAVFPLLFSPCGSGLGFGDSNHFSASAFHYRILQRLNREEFIHMLDDVAADGISGGSWPEPALYFLIGPQRNGAQVPAYHIRANHMLQGMEWAYMADRMPAPTSYMSIRGGTTDVPHGQSDLLSFWFQVGCQPIIINAHDGAYLDTTFSSLRYDLYGCGPYSKNTILINGIGMRPKTGGSTRAFDHDGHFVMQVDATHCYGDIVSYGDPWLECCLRTFINLGEGRYLILDRIRFSNEGQYESRFHTYLPMELAADAMHAVITGDDVSATLSFATNIPVVLRQAAGTPVSPKVPVDTILLAQNAALVPEITLALLIQPGEHTQQLALATTASTLTVSFGSEELIEIPLNVVGDPFPYPDL